MLLSLFPGLSGLPPGYSRLDLGRSEAVSCRPFSIFYIHVGVLELFILGRLGIGIIDYLFNLVWFGGFWSYFVDYLGYFVGFNGVINWWYYNSGGDLWGAL